MDGDTHMPTLPAPLIDFLVAVDGEIARMRVKFSGKIHGVSTFIRDVYAWRKSAGADELVGRLAAAMEELSKADISGERGSGRGSRGFAGGGSACVVSFPPCLLMMFVSNMPSPSC